jgi:hypothetical protein
MDVSGIHLFFIESLDWNHSFAIILLSGIKSKQISPGDPFHCIVHLCIKFFSDKTTSSKSCSENCTSVSLINSVVCGMRSNTPQITWDSPSPTENRKMDPETFSTYSESSMISNNPKNRAAMGFKTFSGE